MSGFLKHGLICLLVLCATGLFLGFGNDITLSDKKGVHLPMPLELRGWKGKPISYCHDPVCYRKVPQVDREAEGCQYCGKEVFQVNFGEQMILSADTEFYKTRYDRRDGVQIESGITLCGKDRSSIHRPEVCITSQDWEIMYQETVQFDIPGREPLSVRVLDLSNKQEGKEDQHTYYAYWFVGSDRETADHMQRILWMASDRLLKGLSHRWAYVYLQGDRDPRTREHIEQLGDLLSELVPAVSGS